MPSILSASRSATRFPSGMKVGGREPSAISLRSASKPSLRLRVRRMKLSRGCMTRTMAVRAAQFRADMRRSCWSGWRRSFPSHTSHRGRGGRSGVRNVLIVPMKSCPLP